jgi:hypothetical protein
MTDALWIAFLAIVVVGLAIPIFRVMRRPDPPDEFAFSPDATAAELGPVLQRLAARIDALEGEVDDLSATVEQLRDENEVLQRMIENRPEARGR